MTLLRFIFLISLIVIVQVLNAEPSHNTSVNVGTKAFSGLANSFGDHVGNAYAEVIGTDLETISTVYEGESISYQYHIWKIKHETICSNYQNITDISRCSLKAKSLFQQLCLKYTKMRESDTRNWKLKKYKNMYCSASVNYQPVIASISPANSDPKSKLQKLKKQCNDLIFQSMSSDSTSVIEKERDKICGQYEKLKKHLKAG